jgi:hypothetical protein
MSSRNGLREVFPVAPMRWPRRRGSGSSGIRAGCRRGGSRACGARRCAEVLWRAARRRRRAPGDAFSDEKAQDIRAPASRSLWMNRAATTFFRFSYFPTFLLCHDWL